MTIPTITSVRRSTVTDYRSAAEYLGSRSSRPAGNNTSVERLAADAIGIRLHRTIVVIHYADGVLTLNSGGWRSVTTAHRMSAFSRVGVSFRQSGATVRIRSTGTELPFTDGMVIMPDA